MRQNTHCIVVPYIFNFLKLQDEMPDKYIFRMTGGNSEQFFIYWHRFQTHRETLMGALIPSTWSLFSSNSVTEFSFQHSTGKFSTIHWFLIIHQPTIPSFSSLQQIHHHQPPEPSGKIEANSRNKDHKRGKTGICRGYSLPHYQALLGLALCCVYFSLFFFSLEPGGSSPLERKLLSACGHRGKCVIIIDGTPV